MNLLNVPLEQFQKAEAFFQDPRNANKKLRRQEDLHYDKYNSSQFSFVKVEGVIYAIQPNALLGDGSFNDVRLIQNKQGENFALKIEGRKKRPDSDETLEIMKELHYFFGQFERPLTHPTVFKEEIVSHKLYTVVPLREGTDLNVFLNQRLINYVDRIAIALLCAIALMQLHRKRILHLDIKPENYMIFESADNIYIKLIDFDFSCKLPLNTTSRIRARAMGSENYAGPEVENHMYGFGTDVYAFAYMLTENLKISEEPYGRIFDSNHEMRPSIESIARNLYRELKEIPTLTPKQKNILIYADSILSSNPENTTQSSTSFMPNFDQKKTAQLTESKKPDTKDKRRSKNKHHLLNFLKLRHRK